MLKDYTNNVSSLIQQSDQVGKSFCDAVAEREGVAGLHRVFDGPDSLPTWAELEAPDAWIARVLRPAA